MNLKITHKGEKLFLFSCLLCITISTYSQSGPGGVGDANSVAGRLVLWLSGEDVSGMMDDRVLSWPNRSGYRNRTIDPIVSASSTPSNVNQHPILKTNTINGINSFAFDGGGVSNNEYFMIPDHAAFQTTQFSLFIVGMMETGTRSYDTFVIRSTGNAWVEGYGLTRNGTSSILWASGFSSNVASRATVSDGVYHIHTGIVDTAIDYYLDEGDLQTGTVNFNYVGNAPFSIGSSVYTASTPSPVNPLVGEVGEVIFFNEAVNTTERLLINNYLSSKYDIPLSNNDLYTMDTNGNGDYDFDVVGIGQSGVGDDHTDVQSAGLVQVSSPSDLSTGEFLLFGHDGGASTFSSEEIPTGPLRRLERVWRVDETGEVGDLTVNVDLSNYSFSLDAEDVYILFDSDEDFSDATAIAASSVINQVYQFNTVSNFNSATYFTIAVNAIPTPVELTTFSARAVRNHVDLEWETASELNNDYFAVERSRNGDTWEVIAKVDGKGTTNEYSTYRWTDTKPSGGVSYYRLKQTDFDGTYEYSETKMVANSLSIDHVKIYPNPVASKTVTIESAHEFENITIYNALGQKYTPVWLQEGSQVKMEVDQLDQGVYVLNILFSNNEVFRERLVIR